MTPAFFDALHADPWAQDFFDLATLNARASGAVETAIEALHQTARTSPHSLRSTSLVILGPPGAGKTHLFARLRRRVGPRAVFVHIRPLVHAEMNARFLLGEVVRQLGFPTSQGMPQASALVGSLLGYLGGVGTEFPSTVLAEYADLPADMRDSRLDKELERLFVLWPELDESYLRRLLAVPFAVGATGRALLTWLSGRDCDVAQLQRIGAMASLGEEHAFAALRTLAAVASLGSPLVLVFDQLENLIDAEGAGPRLRAYAHLAAECVDTLRGTVVVHLALDSEWQRGIEPAFNLSQRSRIVMGRQLLELPRATEREELLRRLHERVPDAPEPFPWPLGERRLARLRSTAGSTPRMLLIEFRRALEGEADDAAPEEQAGQQAASSAAPNATAAGATALQAEPERRDLQGEWQSQLQQARELLQRAGEERQPLDAARLADGIFACAPFIPQLTIRTGGRPPAQLVLQRNGENEALALVQESHPRSAGLLLTRLTGLSNIMPVVAVRERVREFPPTWTETLRKQTVLLDTGRARWIDIEPEDCARVLALAALLQAARSGDVSDARGVQVTEAEVEAWAKGALEIPDWAIARALQGNTEAAAPLLQDDEEDAESVPAASSPQAPTTERLPPPTLEAAALPRAVGSAMTILRRLRVASFDRLVREVSRVDPTSTRASVQTELEAEGERVRWFGRSTVFFRSGE
ncbi:MAG: hypothetical protein RL685_2032 [Pseudomonadota bacterium]